MASYVSVFTIGGVVSMGSCVFGRRTAPTPVWALVSWVLFGVSVSGVWQAPRGDNARSGCARGSLALPLQLHWEHASRHAPSPAWPEPGVELHRMPFDYAYQVTIAGDTAYFGSSSDHKVYALDLASGEERWSFFTGGPVRFAPAVAQERVLVVADDGFLYCLSAADGRLLWKVRGGPRDERLPGNDQMVSRWPPRSGVLVREGVAYFTAGMWQVDGIVVRAVRVEDGSSVWTNDACDQIYMEMPHDQYEGIGAVAPQGYLVAWDDTLLVPTGRGTPAGFDLETGRLLYYDNTFSKAHHAGGSWAFAAEGLVFTQDRPVGSDSDAKLGEEALSDRGSGLMAWDCRSGTERLALKGKLCAVFAAGTLYAAGQGELSAIRFDAFAEAAAQSYGRPAHVRYPWRATRVPSLGGEPHTLWKAPCGPRTYEMALVGRTLFLGGQSSVRAFDIGTGNVVWSCDVEGQARGLAVADGRLVVSTTSGRIYCYGGAGSRPAVMTSPPEPATAGNRVAVEAVSALLRDTAVTTGYACVVGDPGVAWLQALAKGSELRIVCVEPDAKRVEELRKGLDRVGIYGKQVAVHQRTLRELPYAGSFANLIVLPADFLDHQADVSASEVYRILRPYGGILYWSCADPASASGWLQQGGIAKAEVTIGEGIVKVVRGALPGAGEWTHQYADAGGTASSGDDLVQVPFRMQWFGGPGPGRGISRHWRSPSPIFANGRLFVAGQNHLTCLDGYNGTQHWTREITGIGRFPAAGWGGNVVADQGNLYAATGNVCFQLDAGTGQTRRAYRIPFAQNSFSLDESPTFSLEAEAERRGEIVLAKGDAGLVLTLTTRDDRVTNPFRESQPFLGDCWELYFDFRPEAERQPLYSRGAFQVFVVPSTIEHDQATWRTGTGDAHPVLQARALTSTEGQPGSRTQVTIKWSDIAAFAGPELASFAFGATLVAYPDAQGTHLPGYRGKKGRGQEVKPLPLRRIHRFAGPDSHRLTTGWARFMLNGSLRAAEQVPVRKADYSSRLLPRDWADRLGWNYLAVVGDAVLGSVGVSNFKWSFWPKAHPEDRALFALDRDTGAVRWIHRAEASISSHMITVQADRVLVVDRPTPAKRQAGKRRGKATAVSPVLRALDLVSGQIQWSVAPPSLAGKKRLQAIDGVVVASGSGLAVYSADNGEELWADTRKGRSSMIPPVLVDGTIYAYPGAFDLRTGAQKMRRHPLTGEPSPFLFHSQGKGGCAAVSGCTSTLFFRVGSIAFHDLKQDDGMHWLGQQRPSCWMNIIPAGGLVMVPEGSSNCTCGYNFQTSLALAPAPPRANEWAVLRVGDAPAGSVVKQLRLNVGAPADKRDSGGNLWLAFPRPFMPGSVMAPATVEGTPTYSRRNPDGSELAEVRKRWLYASGGQGLRGLTVDLSIDRPAVAPSCPTAPVLDGRLTDSCWDGAHPIAFVDRERTVYPLASGFLRHDDKNLYISLRRTAPEQAGKPVPWVMNTPRRANDAGDTDPVPANSNLLINGAFDQPGTGGLPTGWKAMQGSAGAIAREAGRNVLVMDKSKGLAGQFEQTIPVKPEWRQVRLSGRMKAEGIVQGRETWHRAGIGLRVIVNGARTGGMSRDLTGGTEGKWILYDHTLDLPPGAEAVMVRLRHYGTAGWIRFDDIGLEPITGTERRSTDPWGEPVWDDDSWNVRISDSRNKFVAYMGVSVSGARFGTSSKSWRVFADDHLSRSWRTAVRVTPEEWALEMAIPWAVLAEIGAKPRKSLRIYIRGTNKTGVGPDMFEFKYPSWDRWRLNANFARLSLESPPPLSSRNYTVRLFFSASEGVLPGQSVFDVSLQGRLAARAVDVAVQTRDGAREFVREFHDIEAGETIGIGFTPRSIDGRSSAFPILHGLEIVEETGE
ncbi:MAG: PQQ-binding-like beta-propeller repeat protein [Lentisphaerae bacterium]|nr:PQQ-binding-like beta-propeller repeat protein [Lentisphaerota bacterium]